MPAALENFKRRAMVQCGPIYKVAKSLYACMIVSVHNFSGSVQPFVPLPGIATFARGRSGTTKTCIRHRRAPLEVYMSRGGLHDQM